MPLYYFESDLGCGLRKFANLQQARKQIVREVGIANRPEKIQKATKDQINWVEGMGGKVPKL